MSRPSSRHAAPELRELESAFWSHVFGRVTDERMRDALQGELDAIDRELREALARGSRSAAEMMLRMACASSNNTALRAIHAKRFREALDALRTARKLLGEVEAHIAAAQRIAALTKQLDRHIDGLRRPDWRRYSTLRVLDNALRTRGPALLEMGRAIEARAVARWTEGEMTALFVDGELSARLQEEESAIAEVEQRKLNAELGVRQRILDVGLKIQRAAQDNARAIEVWLDQPKSGTEGRSGDEQDP